jgi:hypothetical protein
MEKDLNKNCCTCAESIWIYGTHNDMKCKLDGQKIKDKFKHCQKWRDAFEKVNKNEK